MKVLIAGCGYVGTALAGRLLADGASVVGLRRSDSELPLGATLFRADVTDPSTLAAVPADVTHLVYCASPGERSEAAYRAAYVDGLANVRAALTKAGAPLERVLLTTSTAVYGQSNGEWVDETSPTEPSTFSGQILLEAERALLAGPAPAIAVRLAGIYGPGRTRLVSTVADGTARRPATPHFTNRIHLDDCAGALAHLLTLSDPAPVYLGVDEDPADLGDVLAFIAGELGVPAPPVGEAAPAPGRRSRGHKRCRGDRLRASGYAFRHETFRSGYPGVIASFRGATRP